MKKFFVFFLLPFLFACQTSTYIQTTTIAPMFEKEKEIQVTGFLGLNHVEGNLAVRPLKNWGFTASAYNGFKRNFEFAPGYLINKDNFRHSLDLFLGYGQGDHNETNNTSFNPFPYPPNDFALIDSKHQYLFIQPNYNYRFEEGSLCFSSKFSYFKYDSYTYREYTFVEWDQYHNRNLYYQVIVDSLVKKNFRLIAFHPAISFKAGGKHLKVFGQMSFTIIPFGKTTSSAGNLHPFHTFYIFSTGLQYNLSYKRK